MWDNLERVATFSAGPGTGPNSDSDEPEMLCVTQCSEVTDKRDYPNSWNDDRDGPGNYVCTECMDGCTSCLRNDHCSVCNPIGYQLMNTGKHLSFHYNLTLPRCRNE